jgi:hypothetical protein
MKLHASSEYSAVAVCSYNISATSCTQQRNKLHRRNDDSKVIWILMNLHELSKTSETRWKSLAQFHVNIFFSNSF